MNAQPLFVPGSAAALAFLACAALGAKVSKAPPNAFDRAGRAVRGHAVAAARIFTALGRSWSIVLVTAGALAGVAVTRGDPRPLVVLVASQLASQAVVAILKRLLRRPRPVDYIGKPEPDYGYPSGHAATAVVFYGGLIGYVAMWQTPTAGTLPSIVALAACCLGLPWSRLALGAHYATDVVGGLLLGAGWSWALVALGAPYARAF